MNKQLLTGMIPALALWVGLADAAPAWVQIPVTKVFAPMGFDSNDDTQVIVSGVLPDLCYQSPKASATIEEGVVKVIVEAIYEAPEGVACAQLERPFLEKASLKVLEAGEYRVQANVGTAQLIEEKILITQAASVDVNDHVYAGVDYVERVENSRDVVLYLNTPSDCYELDRVEQESNEKDTFSVKPIMRKIRNHCPIKTTEFKQNYTVPEGLPAEKILLHVRTLQGDSYNTLYQNK